MEEVVIAEVVVEDTAVEGMAAAEDDTTDARLSSIHTMGMVMDMTLIGTTTETPTENHNTP